MPAPLAPTTLADALIQAHTLHGEGRNDEARILLLAIIEQSPTPVASALMLLGRMARTEGRAAEAADWLGAAMEAEPGQPLPRVALAELALARGLPDEAEELLRQALALDRACVPALVGLGLAQMARGRHDEAEASFRAACAADPAAAAAHFHLGNALFAGGQPLPAEASFRRALRLAPEDAEIAAALGLALRAQGQEAEALPFLERAAMAGSADHLAALGVGLAALGRTAEADSAFRRALESAPDFVPAHEGLARLRLAAHDAEGAAVCFRRALALEPEAWPLELGLGGALRLAGAVDEARACYRRVADRPGAAVQSGLTDLLEGRRLEGWAALAQEWRAGRLTFSPLDPPGPRWDGAPLPDLALLVDCGLDAAATLTMMPFLAAARARVGRLVVVCRPELRRLLAALPSVDAAISEGDVPGGYAAHAALEVLPALLGLNAPPPLAVPVARSDWQRWQTQLSGRPRLGVIRRGAAHALGPAFHLPAAELNGFELDTCVVRDMADMAAALAQFDHIVGADGPVLRLAALLGVPCLAVIAPVGDWVWGRWGENSDWFPSVRLWRWKAGDESRLVAEMSGDFLQPPAGH